MSGGGSKNQTVTQTSEPPSWAVPYMQDAMQRAQQISSEPYSPYTGQLVAGLNADQLGSQEMMRQLAYGPSIVNNGNQYAAGLLGGAGQYQGGLNPYMATLSGGDNPYMGATNALIGQVGSPDNPYMGATNALIGNISSGASNPYIGAVNPLIGGISGGGKISAGTNKFAGSNPYLGQMIADSSRDVTDAYSNATVPNMLAQFQQGGAFGGTAMQNAATQANNTLAQNLSDLSNQYRFQDYQTQQSMDESRLARQAQLSDSAANRNMQASIAAAQLYDQGMARSAGLYGQDADRALQAGLAQANLYGQDLSRNAQLGESAAARALQGSLSRADLYGQDLSRNAQLGDSAASRGLQAQISQAGFADNALSRDQQAWSQYQANQMAALGMIPGLNQASYYGSAMLGQLGSQNQQLAQQALDAEYNQYLDARNWDIARYQPLLQGLAAAQGGTVTSQQPYQGPSPAAGALGGAASGAAVGSTFGPWGAVIGGGIGAIGGYLGSR
jgi:hypothetical protein